MKKLRQIGCILVSLMVMVVMVCPVMNISASSKTGSITYSYPADGVTFKLYKVGEIEDDEFVLTGDYADYKVEMSAEDNDVNKAAAETLSGYVASDGLSEMTSATVEDGSVKFDNLEMGIYLMIGEKARVDDTIYIPEPVLFSVPQDAIDGSLAWDFTADGKFDEVSVDKTDIHVEKVWKDTGYTSQRPTEITVQLIQDGEVIDETVLNSDNEWKADWEELDADHVYEVVEKDKLSNYTVKVEHNKTTYVITNTYDTPNSPDDSETPSGGSSSKIPQTGQLWWPVGILCVTGIALILIGLIRRKKYED